MRVPDVSVVVGVYQGMPFVVKCLESVAAQTLGADRIELIVVNDGSTDGSAEFLEKFAAESAVPTTVIHQENSGGPSKPRNVGLAAAAGRWVFFLDADDYLGPEALERMVAMGDENGTDVVVGKIVGVGRGAPKSMWTKNIAKTDIFATPTLKYTLSAQKLFRRELAVRLGLAFPENLTTGEDAAFTLPAYLRGSGISLVADYDCYFLVRRGDGQHATQRGGHEPRFESARVLMELITKLQPPGLKRDQLMMRPFQVTLLAQFKGHFLTQDEETRRAKQQLAKPLLDTYWTQGVSRLMPVDQRLITWGLSRDRLDLVDDVLNFRKAKKKPKVVKEKGGTFLAYPHFRDDSGVPDDLYRALKEYPTKIPAQGLKGVAHKAVRRALSEVRSRRAA
ncbi:glycosyltransferase family A protein [Streptomyces sp. NPDC051940]|uniref:glycosyltransferase family 2 protein n=1 Tax=Streptomyces sp. NPDC051940 TaxID=3155675 RepID=UPI0034449778